MNKAKLRKGIDCRHPATYALLSSVLLIVILIIFLALEGFSFSSLAILGSGLFLLLCTSSIIGIVQSIRALCGSLHTITISLGQAIMCLLICVATVMVSLPMLASFLLAVAFSGG